MANVYATKNGVWSDITVWNTGALPTTADDVFANNFTVDIDIDVTVLSIRNTAAAPIVAGGGFTCGSGRIITCTATQGYLRASNDALITFSHASGSSDLYGNIFMNTIQNPRINGAITVTSTGTLNYVGNISNASGVIVTEAIRVSGGGTVNMVGNINVTWAGSIGARVSNGSTFNLTGDCYMETPASANNTYPFTIDNATVNITGNYTMGSMFTPGSTIGIQLNNNAVLNIIGNVIENQTALSSNDLAMIRVITASYVKIVGSLIARRNPVIISALTSSINIFSGPFICGEYGEMPYMCSRMHLIPSIGTYFEFRDETTNGALSPGAIAPATRLITLGAAVDAPDEGDVRDGVLYASSSLEGKVVIPHVDNVSVGIPVDVSDVGTAVLKGEDVWNVAIANLTTPNSIGERLKNASTVDTMGAQLEAVS